MRACKGCGRQWSEDLRFCGACGASLSASSDAAPDFEDELRHATVLFADMVGFTEYSESRSADEVGTIIGDVMNRLLMVLRRHGGTTEKYLGDALLSTFGLRQPDPQPARSAVRAALELQRTMTSYRVETGRDLHLRIGVHVGELMVRKIDGAWAVVGDTVNTAARLQEVADPDTVWISRALYDEVRPYVEVIARPTLPLKGKSLPMQPYEIRRERDTAATTVLPFIGRGDESRLLGSELDRALTDKTSRIVIVRGAAGVGKSRLLTELQDRLEADDRLFRFDRIEYDRADVEPAGGLASLIRHRFHLDAEADEVTTRAALRVGAASELPVVDDRHLDFLAFVLGLGVSGTGVGALDTEAIWTGAYAVMHGWMQAQARVDPWVVTFEDAHFGDPETVAFLDWSLGVGWEAPLFVVITVREEDFSAASEWHSRIERWLANGLAIEIVLQELATDDLAAALLALPDSTLDPEVAVRVAEHAEGHPLFALELVDFLAVEGALTDVARMNSTILPGTVREAMEARIERLGWEGKQVAKRAAFIGRRFTRDAVARIWTGTNESLEEGLEILRRTLTVFEDAAHGTDGPFEMVFRHGRLQEAALARVPREERLRWHQQLEEWAHARLAAATEDVDRVGIELIPLIARSRVAHEDDLGAAYWLEAVGLIHRRQHQSSEAAQAFLSAASHTSGTRKYVLESRAAGEVAARGDLARALAILEHPYDAESAHALMPDAMLTRGAEAPLDGWWDLDQEEAILDRLLQRADLRCRTGQLGELAQEFEDLGRQIFALKTKHARALELRWGSAFVYFLCEIDGNIGAAVEVRDRCAVGGSADQHEFHALLAMEDNIAMRSGDMQAAEKIARERLERAQASGDLVEQSIACNSLGIVLSSIGDIAQSLSAYESSLSLSRAMGDLRGEAISLHNLGILYFDKGDFDQARQFHEDYHAKSLRIGNWMAESYAPIHLGLIAIEMGDDAGAEQALRKAWQAAESHGWPRLSALARAMHGAAQVRRGVRSGDGSLVRIGADLILEHESDWSGLDDVGELYAVAAIATGMGGQREQAEEILLRCRLTLHPSWSLATTWCDAAADIVAGGSAAEQVAWLHQRECHRAGAVLKMFGSSA